MQGWRFELHVLDPTDIDGEKRALFVKGMLERGDMCRHCEAVSAVWSDVMQARTPSSTRKPRNAPAVKRTLTVTDLAPQLICRHGSSAAAADN